MHQPLKWFRQRKQEIVGQILVILFAQFFREVNRHIKLSNTGRIGHLLTRLTLVIVDTTAAPALYIVGQ